MPFRSCLIAALVQCVVSVCAHAQALDDTDVLSRAEALSKAEQYSSVVQLLDPYVREHPNRAEAWLLLARHRYWIQDMPGARRTYARALEYHPAHTELRLAYAKFLLENGDREMAGDIVATLGSDVAEAEAIRGTLAWWGGALTSAARYFENTLQLDPTHAEAAAALSSIRADAQPWIRLAGTAVADNQPLTRGGTSVEAGIFLTPLQAVRAEVGHTRFSIAPSNSPLTRASATLQSFWPALRMETSVAAGVMFRMDSTYWTGRLEAGYRLPYGTRISALWERAAYLYTEASISQSVLTSSLQVSVSADRAGWLGEAALRRDRFPDHNKKQVAYGWLMAPIIRTRGFTLQAGYAYGYQNADESRFAAVIHSAPGPGRPPVWEGRYVPYYTPLNVQTHSLTGRVTIQAPGGLSFHTNGSYGFLGSEDAPYVYVAGRAPMTGTYEHRIRPWTVRAGIDAGLGGMATIQVEGSHMATAWYDASSISLSVYMRL